MAEPTEVERLRDQLLVEIDSYASDRAINQYESEYPHQKRRMDSAREVRDEAVDALIAAVRAEALAELMPWEMDDLAEPFRHSEQYSDQVADQAIAAYRRLRGAK